MRTDVPGKARSFLDAEVISRLSPIPLTSRRPMMGSVSGRHASPHRGSSVEFAEYRKYVPGDDPRRLDWRAAGRSDRFYVKEFEADTNLRCVFVVDTSGSMAFEAKTPSGNSITKLDFAKRIVGNLAYLAVEQGDAVGLALAAEKLVREIPARRSPSHLANIFDAVEAAVPHGESRLSNLLHQLAETVPRRAMFLIASDLFFDPSVLRNCLEHLRFRRHDVGLFHLLAPEEVDFTFQRPTRFLDMEGGPSLFVEPNEIADRYRRVVDEYLASVQKVSLETSTDYHRIFIHDNFGDVLYRFLIGRVQRRGRR